jgi:hypothetical protein
LSPLRGGAAAALVALLAACSSTSTPQARPGGPQPSHTTPNAHATGGATPSGPAAGANVRISAAGTLPHGLSRTVAVTDGRSIFLLGGLVAGDVTTGQVLRLDPASGHVNGAGQLADAVHDAAGSWLAGRALLFGGGAAASVSAVQAVTAGRTSVVGRLRGARSDSAAAVLGAAAYVVGGFDGRAMVRQVEATHDGLATTVAGTLALGVRYPAATAAAGAVWVVGGQLATTESTRTGGQTDNIQRFDPATGRTTVVGHLPAPLGHATAFTLGGAVYVAGGRTGTRASRTVWRIDPATGRATVAGRLPVACSDMAAVVIGTSAWLIGGETTGPTAPLRAVVRVDLG